jgi:polar amino acid transport system substrate-binding protein
LSNAQYDAAAANLSTEGKPGLDFAEPVVWSYASLVVLKSQSYDSMDHMDGKVVAAIQGSQQETQVKSYSKVTYSAFPNAPAMLAALRGGQIDAFLVGDTQAQPLVQQNSDIQTTQQIPATGRTGYPVPKGHDAMLNAINTELNNMMADGTFMKFYNKWFTSPPAPKILELYPVLAGQH